MRRVPRISRQQTENEHSMRIRQQIVNKPLKPLPANENLQFLFLHCVVVAHERRRCEIFIHFIHVCVLFGSLSFR